MQRSFLFVYSRPCSYVFLFLPSTHSLQGTVVNAAGKPMSDVSVGVLLVSDKESMGVAFTRIKTDANGRFKLNGIPSEPAQIVVFQKTQGRDLQPDTPIYYSDVFTPNAQKTDLQIQLQLPERLAKQ